MQPVAGRAPRAVLCPACGKSVAWIEENRHRPFCSARCKGLDLGAWASEQYRVEGPESDPGEGQAQRG